MRMIEWRIIPDWPEYEVSNPGAMVRKVSTGKELTPYANAWGLLQVRLAKSRTQRSWRSMIALHKLAFPELYVKAPKPVPMPEPMEGEEFREYGKYLVSNLGRVWSKALHKIVRIVEDGNGHHVDGRRMREIVFNHDIPTLPGEVWKNHRQFPGHAFSNLGRVYSYWLRSIITPSVDGKYIKVNYRGKKYRLHRIIAELFIPNPYDLPEVDHINEDRYDNRVDNLRWCTKEQNLQYYAENHYR
ncbi:MAG: HNH endonuclease [Bacteroidales bacterium]|nr:HNH endonuclease [Bacteroidales bacterium]